MLLAVVSGVSPMPQPVPKALVARAVPTAPKPVLMGLAVGLHLGYGGSFGALLARAKQPVTVKDGAGLGVTLWVLMGIVFLPFLGWGPFGTAVTPKIAGATLILHLIYGGVLGWTLTSDGR